MCSDECKKSLDDLGLNPIGRHMTCCRCDGDRKCADETKNIGLFCEVDLNNAKYCQNDQRMCNDTRDDDRRGMMGNNEGQNQRRENEGPSDQDQRNRNEECDMDERPESRSNKMQPRDQSGKIYCIAMNI